MRHSLKPPQAPKVPGATSDSPGELTTLDVAALILGAAVAAVHVRNRFPVTATPFGWFMIWLSYSVVALTAAGPFLWVGRHRIRRQSGSSSAGDQLWAMLGLPWCVTAPLRPAQNPARSEGSLGIDPAALDLGVAVMFWVLMAGACLIAVTWLVRYTTARRPEGASARADRTWTSRTGVILAAAWPIQFAVGVMLNS